MENKSDDYTVETIETLEEFKELKEDWERLYNLKENITVFFSFDVFRIYYENFSPPNH